MTVIMCSMHFNALLLYLDCVEKVKGSLTFKDQQQSVGPFKKKEFIVYGSEGIWRIDAECLMLLMKETLHV